MKGERLAALSRSKLRVPEQLVLEAGGKYLHFNQPKTSVSQLVLLFHPVDTLVPTGTTGPLT
jgi:hypothetical protein